MSEARLYKGRLPPIFGLLVLTAGQMTRLAGSSAA